MTRFKNKKRPPAPKPQAEVHERITALLEKRKQLAAETHANEIVVDNVVDELVKPLRPDVEYPLATFTWRCEDLANPTGYCVYDDDADPCHDECLFCGDPEERK